MTMHKFTLTLVSLLVVGFLHAQLPSILMMCQDTSWRSKNMMAIASGEAGIGSNALDVAFMQKALLGGRLEPEHIERLSDRMPSRSRAGYVGSAQLELLNFRDTLFSNPRLGLRACLSTNYQGYLGFQPSLFRTIFQGNSGQAGSAVALGPLAMQNQAWQKFGFGLFNKSTLSGFTLSLVEGQSYQSLVIDQLSLFTAAAADSLSLSTTGEFFRSDTLRSGWANGSGIGACIDLDYNLPLRKGKSLLSLTVRNLGFVTWNSESEHYSLDGSTAWNGVNVTDWLSGSDAEVMMPSWSDSLNSARTQSSSLKSLPTTVSFRYITHWRKKHYWETGWSLAPNRAWVPQAYVGMAHALNDRLWVSERISYGGYAGFAVGAEVQWLSKNAWFVRAGATQLEGWFLSQAGGRNVYFNLGKNF